MANFHTCFEPIHESTVFGNMWDGEDERVRADFTRNKDDLLLETASDPLTQEDKDEMNTLCDALQKAKSMVKVELDRYHELKDEHDDYSALRRLIDTTLDDMVRKLDFLRDAYRKKMDMQSFPLEDKYHTNATENIQQLRETMLANVNACLANNDEKLSGARTKLRMLSHCCSISNQIGQNYYCPICYQKEVDVFCDPCGHTFCKGCIKTNYCYLCRSKINKVSKLFFT